MRLLISSSFYFFAFQLLLSPVVYSQSPDFLELQAYRTRAIAHIFSLIQCFPDGIDNDVLGSAHTNLPPIPELLSSPANHSFNPENHLDQYSDPTEVRNLLDFVAKLRATGTPDNLPFTNDPTNVENFGIILVVLWNNADNWSIFYATAAWLVGRVNSAMLFWALMIVSAEKFSDTVTVPSTVEIFPQLYAPREWVLAAAQLPTEQFIPYPISTNPLQYWTGDPGLNEFHTHFHMDNPYWWDANYFGVARYRKGELFLFMHHQIVNRYNAERLSHGLPEAEPLGITSNYSIPEGYRPDICNVDYDEFPPRPDNWLMGNFDDGPTTLRDLQIMHDRLAQGITLGYFIDTRRRPIYLNGTNGTDILGATVESSNVYSANYAYYGYFHNLIHSYLSGQLRMKAEPIPGVQAHQETSMRDRVFYQIHTLVDLLYLQFKNNKQLVPAYKPVELEFPGITILEVKILACPRTPPTSWASTIANLDLSYPFTWQQLQTPVLTTYMTTVTYDIANAARPCRSIWDPPQYAPIRIINHASFTYVIAVQSTRSTVAYGMVRIFIWPEKTLNGTKLEGDSAHVRAIELDRFRVRLDPGQVKVIKRDSKDSSLARAGQSPGIKTLYNIEAGDDLLTNPYNRRACAFPNNMLIPRGTSEGLGFRMTVYISDETEAGGDVVDYPYYPFCGALNGLPFPDRRPMGFPFDRPGTSFGKMGNVKQLPVIIRHDDQESRMFM